MNGALCTLIWASPGGDRFQGGFRQRRRSKSSALRLNKPEAPWFQSPSLETTRRTSVLRHGGYPEPESNKGSHKKIEMTEFRDKLEQRQLG